MKKYAGIIICVVLLACHGRHSEKGVELAMKQYDHLIKKMDADSIALLYTADGDLGAMAHGRDSIRIFLASFKDIQVLFQQSTTRSIHISHDTALQQGFYHQTVLINKKDTMSVSGQFTATWYWTPPGEWHIKKMMTTPME